MNSFLNWSKTNPKQLFLIDAAGALLSIFMLGFVLVKMESFFGIPKEVLYVLASIPIGFLIYDLICYFTFSKSGKKFLIGIAILNISYCILSLGYAYLHMESLSIFGWLYIIGEICLVLFLSRVELKVGLE